MSAIARPESGPKPGAALARPADPATVGKYRVLGLVGRGAFGAVYRCQDPALGRVVCVKLLHGGAGTPDAAERFAREARAAAKLSHPHVVSVFEAGHDGDRPFLVMEYVEGHPLDRLIGTPRLTVETTLRVVFHLAQALQAAHDGGIVHRDVKPANVLIDAAGRPKLADFGLARLDDAPGLSRSGDLIGTPRYMSPEMALLPAAEVDHRTDLYSLGAVMYEMLTGRPVADGPTALAVLRKVTDEPLVPVRELAPAVPAEVAAVCERLLAKDRDARYPTAAAAAQAIQDYFLAKLFGTPEVELLAGLPALPPPAAPRRPWPLALALLVAAAAAVVVAVVLTRGRGPVPAADPPAAPAVVVPAPPPAAGPDPARVAAEAEAELPKLRAVADERAYRAALSDLLDGLNAALKRHPAHPELLAARGRALRRAGEYLAAAADFDAADRPDLAVERALARYQWEVVYLNGISDSSLRPVPSRRLTDELAALAGRGEPAARALHAVGAAVAARDHAAAEKALAALAALPPDADAAMVEADALTRLADDAHDELQDAAADKKAEWRAKRDAFDARAAQALRRGLSADPHHLGLLFLKAAGWHLRVGWESADGDDREQLLRRHRPAFESAYQRFRVGAPRVSTEAATARAILLAGAGRNDQALDPLNEAAGRGPLPPAVAAFRGWLQLAAPPDWNLSPEHAAGVIQQLAPAIEQHPDEFTLYLVRAVAHAATGRWEDARRDVLDGKKVYRGGHWPPPGSVYGLCRDAAAPPLKFLDTATDVIWNFPTAWDTRVKLGEEFLRRATGPDDAVRKGLSDADLRDLIGWGHYRQAKFHADKDDRAAVLRHTRAALEMRLSDLTADKFRTDGNLKAWNDDPEFQKLYAEFGKK